MASGAKQQANGRLLLASYATSSRLVRCRESAYASCMLLKPIAFLDRDGVLNIDRAYLYKKEEFVFVEEAPQAVRWLNERGFLVVIVTNQSGIARGYYSEAQFAALTEWMKAELIARGARVDAVYYCPHHPTEGVGSYCCECDCRKPKPGMLLRALAELSGDSARSFLIGNNPRDVDAAHAAGLAGHLYLNGSLLSFVTSVVNSMDASR